MCAGVARANIYVFLTSGAIAVTCVTMAATRETDL